jgi:hypothetical protein
MSSPNIRVQTLIRKFRNGSKELLDKKKIIAEYSYSFAIEDILTTGALFKEKEKTLFEYDLLMAVECKSVHKTNKCSASINIEETTKINPDQEILISPSPDAYFIDNNPLINRQSSTESINDYIGDGYFKNIYNAEYCDIDWVIMTYCINRLYPNFITSENIKIKSLHINTNTYAELSAINHFLFNSKIQRVYKTVEWNWVTTVVSDESVNRVDKAVEDKYKNSVLHLFTPHIKNGLNYIINETAQKIGKINLLCINRDSDIYDYVSYAVVAVKLLDNLCIFYMRFPPPGEWTSDHINALLLYVFIFQEVYLFKIDIESEHMVIVAKNKKRMAKESVYKKLLSILSLDLHRYNLFSRETLDQNYELHNLHEKIISIIKNNDARAITFGDMKYEISKVLEMNTDTFF